MPTPNCFFDARTRLCVAVCAVLAGTPLFAAEPSTQPQVIVTARREPTSVDASLAAVRVIERAEIERRQASDLFELLRTEAGIDLSRSGGLGQSTSLFQRGSNSNHSLVLIDGVRVGSATSGLYDLAHLPLEQVERIEIVRGPRAVFFGSDAIGGVIQIFTRRIDKVAGRIAAGRYGRFDIDAGFGHSGEPGGFSVSAGRSRASGFSATDATAFGHHPDADGYENQHARVNAGLNFGVSSLQFVAQATRAKVDFDQGQTEADNTSALLRLDGELATDWSHRLDFGHSREDLDTAAYFSAYRARRDSLDWHHQWSLADRSRLSFGINALRERGAEIETFGGSTVFSGHRHNEALYASWQRGIGRHDIEFSARHDQNSVFGGHGSAQLAWGLEVGSHGYLRASLGNAFRAPSLNELYSPGFGGLFAGNAELQPEQSEHAEIGYRHRLGHQQQIAISAYQSRVEDLISFSGGLTFQAVNIARADLQGIEFEYEGQADAWHWQAQATLQDAENRDTGRDLLRRPGRKASAQVDYGFTSGLNLGAEWLVSGTREDFDGTLPGYAVVHLFASYPLTNDWRLGLRLENATNRDYHLLSGYNTAARAAQLSIAYGN